MRDLPLAWLVTKPFLFLLIIAISCQTRFLEPSGRMSSVDPKAPPGAEQVSVEFFKLGSAVSTDRLVANQKVQQKVPGERVAIRICGLGAGLSYRLQVALGSATDVFRSWGDFDADTAGCIATDRQAPRAGTYVGADADGLFWSMSKSGTAKLSLQTGSYDVRLFAASGEEVFVTKLPIKIVGEGIQISEVSLAERGFVGRLYMPANVRPGPVVVTTSGSEGGIESGAWTAAALANEGVPALAVAYFGLPGLLQSLAMIPLEYFANAFAFLKGVPALSDRQIVVMGPSRGGELSLLLGATFAQVAGVVAVVPSPYVWGGNSAGPKVAAWTYRGQVFPFQKTVGDLEPFVGADGVSALSNRPAFERALNSIPMNMRSTIWLERINGPVLLLGASDDQVWPSCQGVADALARLKSARHPYADAAECYPNAGHDLGVPFYPTTSRSVNHPFMGVAIAMGGTAEGTGRGQRAAWTRILEFLSALSK